VLAPWPGHYSSRRGTQLPWKWYADPEVLRLEGERIFARTWQYVGHTGQVAEVGFFAATAGQIPVVVMTS
jgi:phenylpropionate dioxygenase-like ring-hydroxylating dioxygenase large terminal subunit